MHRSFTILVALAASALLALAGCGEENTPEACLHQATMDLDAGMYDAVLQSSCATPMQRGAAWFGKAGFDVTSVVNHLIEASRTTATQTDLEMHLDTLTKVITYETFDYLDQSIRQFKRVTASSDDYLDAQFSLAIVEMVKAAALLKSVIDLTGLGSLSSCDLNDNGVPDEADALSCALLVTGTTPTSGQCSLPGVTGDPSYTTTATDILFSGITGTYRGFTVVIPEVVTDPTCTTNYTKTLYKASASAYNLATSVGICQEFSPDNTRSWPCPVASNLDLLAAFEDSLNSSIDAVTTALTGTVGSDVAQSISDFQTDACGANPPATTCDATELSDYIQIQL